MSIWCVALGSAAWSLLIVHEGDAGATLQDMVATFKDNAFPLVYLGGVTTALTNFLQAVGQRGVSAEKASLIYALDPVWGAIFATALLDERLGTYGYVGAGLITLAAAQNAIFALAKEKKKEDEKAEVGNN